MLNKFKNLPKVFIFLILAITISKIWISPSNLYINEIDGANFLKNLFAMFKLNSLTNIYIFKAINLALSFVNLVLFYLIVEKLIKDETSAILSTCFLAVQPISLMFGIEITFHNIELLIIEIAVLVGIMSIEKEKPQILSIVGLLVALVYNGSDFYIALNCLFMGFALYTRKRLNLAYYFIPFLIINTFLNYYFDRSVSSHLFSNLSGGLGYLSMIKYSLEIMLIPFVMLYLIYDKRFQFNISNKDFTYLLLGFLPLIGVMIFKHTEYLNFAVLIAIMFVSLYAGAYIKYAYSLSKNYKTAVIVFLLSNLLFANYQNYYQTEHKPVINEFVSAISQNIGAENLGTRVASDNIALAKFGTKVKAEFSCFESSKQKCTGKNCEKVGSDKIASQYYDYIIFSANMNEDDEINLRRESVINNYRLVYQEEIKAKKVKANTPIRKYLIYKALRLM